MFLLTLFFLSLLQAGLDFPDSGRRYFAGNHLGLEDVFSGPSFAGFCKQLKTWCVFCCFIFASFDHLEKKFGRGT